MKDKQTSILLSILGALFVVFLVGGAYTFYNAKGFSYLSKSSESCNNCHIMNEVYAQWQKSPHGKERVVNGTTKVNAGCQDCHLPHNFINKWIDKAKAGFSHSYAFTFKYPNLPTNLTANKRSKEVVQNNCINCHANYASNSINATTNPHNTKDALNCVSCHADVGHKRSF